MKKQRALLDKMLKAFPKNEKVMDHMENASKLLQELLIAKGNSIVMTQIQDEVLALLLEVIIDLDFNCEEVEKFIESTRQIAIAITKTKEQVR